MSDQIKEVIDHLSTKLEQPAAQLYEMLLRQAWVDGLYLLFVLLSVLIMSYAAYRIFRYMGNMTESISEPREIALFFSAAGLVGMSCISMFYLMVKGAQSALTILFNPEFYALEKLLNTIK